MVCMEEHKMETENENKGSNNYTTLYKMAFCLKTWQPIAAFHFRLDVNVNGIGYWKAWIPETLEEWRKYWNVYPGCSRPSG